MPEPLAVIVTIPKTINKGADVTDAWLAFLRERITKMFPYSQREVSVGDAFTVDVVYPVARNIGSTEWLSKAIVNEVWEAFTKNNQ